MANFTAYFTFFALIASAYAWGYLPNDGPPTWTGECKTGKLQSPINFERRTMEPTRYDKLIFMHYLNAGIVNLTNNGHTVIGTGFDTWGPYQPYIFGGGLKYKYNLVQFHLHWSSNDSTGSEHTVGGLHYSAELHLVHVRADLPLDVAQTTPDGITVIGVFMALGVQSSALTGLEGAIDKISTFGTKVQVNHFLPQTLLPVNIDSFYRYEGSLTTPGCNEGIVWTVFPDPIFITLRQLFLLRKMRTRAGTLLGTNVRPIQPLNGRVVRHDSLFFRSIVTFY
uniref:Carbonic anhydrase n=1 Tax=Panagrellus redivivus TaxID=6233 RepID=A0A7E4W3J6_PANRE